MLPRDVKKARACVGRVVLAGRGACVHQCGDCIAIPPSVERFTGYSFQNNLFFAVLSIDVLK